MSDTQQTQYRRLRFAMDEARRFLMRASEALQEMKHRDTSYRSDKVAAVKRASMDLTRALVDVRKSPYER